MNVGDSVRRRLGVTVRDLIDIGPARGVSSWSRSISIMLPCA